MSLSRCLNAPLKDSVKGGLAAVQSGPKEHQKHRVWIKNHSKIIDSLYLDEAIRLLNPREYSTKPRWDYLVSAQNGGIAGLEPHPAGAGEVDKVIAKKEFSLKILKKYFREGCSVKAWFWVNSKPLLIAPNSADRMKLDAAGIKFSQTPLDIK